MLARHRQLMGSFERVQAFLDRVQLPKVPVRYPEQRAELDAVVPRVRALLTDQSTGQRESRDDTKRQDRARKTLRKDHLAPIARIARAVLPADPTLQKSLALPEAGVAIGRLIAIATGVRETAAKYEQLFRDSGRPEGFLEQLDAAIEAVRQSVLNKAQSVGRHVGAKAGLEQELQRGRRCVQMLDAMVLEAFAGRADMIAEWRVAKRVKETNGASFRGTGGTAEENLEPPKAA